MLCPLQIATTISMLYSIVIRFCVLMSFAVTPTASIFGHIVEFPLTNLVAFLLARLKFALEILGEIQRLRRNRHVKGIGHTGCRYDYFVLVYARLFRSLNHFSVALFGYYLFLFRHISKI